ncbi:hypothetical protein R1flu_021423 [Riccia fluitans]|uniref:Laccase n=1 Tax=Riccia fluitans TaxID=41844 RepID=A0ABD1ZPB4_9MARC
MPFTAATAVGGEHSFCQALQPSPTLDPFVDQLPIPATIDTSNGNQDYKITQKLHRDLPPTTLYAYGMSQATATVPGPTLVATQYQTSHVRYENHIPDSETFLITDRTIHWANPPHGGVPIVTHLHGAAVPSYSDGNPDAWFTAAGDHGAAFVTQNYIYPNSQPPTLLWYHDHTVGITRNNVLAGLAGLYIIRSHSEKTAHANLPEGTNEIPLVIQDKQFWPNGSINFPDVGDSPAIHPNWCPEYFGDTILVNGKAWPYLKVHPEKYRFRMLNAANARFFTLSLSNPTLKFIQIGTDGGFLPNPMVLSALTLAPAYRADVIIDFSNIPVGTTVYMNNSAPAPFPDGNPDFSPPSTNSVMAFKIISRPPGSRSPAFAVPSKMTPVPNPTYNLTTDVYRKLTLIELDDASGNPIGSFLNNLSWTDPVTETPKLGTVEVWDLINFTPDAHPIHIHLINFLMLYQQSFNQTAYEANQCTLLKQFPDPSSCFTQPPQQPGVSQVGWKDTVIVYPSAVTRLWTKWSPRNGGSFPFDPTTAPGYLWHCHILDHEDNDMMRPLAVHK